LDILLSPQLISSFALIPVNFDLGNVGGSPEIGTIWIGPVDWETSLLRLDNQPPLKLNFPSSLKYPSILTWDSSGSPEIIISRIGPAIIGLGNFRSAFG